MSERILVFVSSILDAQKEDLLAERSAVKRAVTGIPLAELWAFEDAPASPKPLEASYLDKVEVANIFVLILGTILSDAVRNEYQLARSLAIPILIFAKKGVQRLREVQDLLDEADVKYDAFIDPADLEGKAKAGIEGAIVQTFKDLQRHPAIPSRRAALLAGKLKDKAIPVSVHPICPSKNAGDKFFIEEVSGHTVRLRRDSTVAIVVPIDRMEILETVDGFALELNGRIQWTDPEAKWKFIPHKPLSEIGVGLTLAGNDQRKLVFMASLDTLGYDYTTCWEFDVPRKMTEGWEVAYSSEGLYMATPALFRTGPMNQILLKKKRG